MYRMRREKREVAPQIIFEDNYLLAIDKPSGWVVNNAQTTFGIETLQDWLNSNFKYPISGDKDLRSGIVHRLDKETSGVLLVAKTRIAFESLQQQFKEREIKKVYLALVHGEVKLSLGKIVAPVGRLPWRRDRFGVIPAGREASTQYKVIEKFSKDQEAYSLVELYPLTGRTHQIRVHMKYLGNPLVGDDFYSGRKTARKDRIWCPRLFLHARSISFFHPVDRKLVKIDSPLPSDLQLAIKYLE